MFRVPRMRRGLRVRARRLMCGAAGLTGSRLTGRAAVVAGTGRKKQTQRAERKPRRRMLRALHCAPDCFGWKKVLQGRRKIYGIYKKTTNAAAKWMLQYN